MSYEVCVYLPQLAADRETASDLWNNERLWDTSLPDHDRSASKWRVKDLLAAHDNRLQWMEPQAPKTGLFAKWFGKPAVIQRHLHLYIDYDYGRMAFDVFDQGIEITLTWDLPRDKVDKHVRALWLCLEQLSASGWSTIYDTERNVILNLATDFDAVTARYLENIGPDEADESPPGSGASTANPVPKASPKGDKPFTGNVD